MGNRDVQQIGEDAAARFLERAGMQIVTRNWRIKVGEIDIVARRGSTLVFVEVKARRSEDFVDPSLGVTYAKWHKLRRLAEAYIAFEKPVFTDCRFDVISVVAKMPEPKLRHFPNAF